MNAKKLLVGTTVLALTLVMGTAVYAASNSAEHRERISMSGEYQSAISFENTDAAQLPEGVFYQEDISMAGDDTMPLEAGNPDDGAIHREDIVVDKDAEGVLSFADIDTKNLPVGEVYRAEISASGDVDSAVVLDD